MAEKGGHSELCISLPDADKESLRHLAKADLEDDLSQCALELIQQAIGKRKLGDYVHVEAHEKAVAKKDREIARLKKELFEAAEIWEQIVRAFHSEDDLQSTGKKMPAYVLERVSSLMDSEKAATEKLQETEKQLQTLQETTIQRSEHEERVDTVSKAKQELQIHLQAETESVKRLNVKLTEQESEINKLKTESNEQEHTIGSLRDELEQTRSDVRTWQTHFSEASQKSWWRKLLETLKREAVITPVIDHETEPSENEDAPEQHTP